MYYPEKYFRGLSSKNKTRRRKEIKKYGSLSWKNPKAYRGFKTDVGVPTKPSKYTRKWLKGSLKHKSKVTGVPLSLIKKSYNRGLAAWRTGHRPGASQQAWGYARVNSFLLCGKADPDLQKKIDC
jgi:hypothetical protein